MLDFYHNGMLIVPTLFWLLLALCCSFAAFAGGKSGRIGVALLMAATLATWLLEFTSGWSQTNWPVMTIDILLFCGLYFLALRSDAYWPIWAAGFHLLTVAGHFASIIMPDFRMGIYWRFSGVWAILVLMAMVVGISVDRSVQYRSRHAA